MLGLLVLFSQHLKHVKVWSPSGEKNVAGNRKGFPLFQVYPVRNEIFLMDKLKLAVCSNNFLNQVLLALLIVWGTCAILTATNILPEGDPGRTDSKINILQKSPWVRVPYPCKSCKVNFTKIVRYHH